MKENRSGKPRFVWIHFIDAHNWTKGASMPRSPAERKALYGTVLARVDGFLGTIVEGARAGGRDPLIAVTSDHGEAFGEHGKLAHSSDLYDTQIHVPLVIAGPGVVPHVVVEPVGLVGLAPTLLDLAGFIPPGMPEMDGQSFASLATTAAPGNAAGGFAYAVMMRDRFVSFDSRAIVRGPWKLIEGPKGVELYDRSSDRGEVKNLAKSHPDKLREMQELLAQRRAIDRRSPFGP
jgi:arylsulfatase A-like enzyme